jgi:DNA mismatch repair ATPase MutS
MKKTINFGTVNYYGKNLIAKVDIEYKEHKDGRKEGQKVLSISGNIGNECVGQCLDTIAEYVNTPLFNEIYRLWKAYHLNDMHPECEHQNELGWKELAQTKVNLYHFKMNREALSESKAIENATMKSLKEGETVTLSEHDRKVLSLNYSIISETEELADDLKNFYKFDKSESKTLGWLNEKDHSQGILSKVCPVCGYKYGNSWNYVAIPENDEQVIYKILKGEF